MTEPIENLPNRTRNSGNRKPRVSLALATAFGLGYLPKAPGTFGSLGGIVLAVLPYCLLDLLASSGTEILSFGFGSVSNLTPIIGLQILLTVMIALVGLWSADRAAKFWGAEDPQKVVVDEVSGQHLALLLGGFWPRHSPTAGNALISPYANHHPDLSLLWANHPLAGSPLISANWKYLLLGFILFRVFDIWKPFPARQAESLPGGLGIMADDWIAGIYAALVLWIARAAGL